MTTYAVGDSVTWLHEPRGGYGYIVPVNGIVVGTRSAFNVGGATFLASNRVQIEVAKATGETVKRWVSVDRLRKREN